MVRKKENKPETNMTWACNNMVQL